MGLDIRLPIGLMFGVFGLLLTTFGLFSSRAIYRASLGININVIWGLVLLTFGIVMLLFERRARAVASKRDESTGEEMTTFAAKQSSE